jgi:predicted NBD/HSP70 family sugar kinase
MSTPDAGPALMRWRHEERVLAALRGSGPLRRADLAERVGLSRTTLSEIVAELLARGAVQVVATDSDVRRGSGRPAELISLDPRSGQYLGIDLARTAVHVTAIDAGHEIIAATTRDLPAEVPWEQRIAEAFEVVSEMERAGTRFGALQGVGVGLPGPYSASWSGDRSEGRAASAEARSAVERAVTERFGVLPLLDTNTRLAALAEAAYGDDVDEDLVYLRVAGGIGGGVVVGGRLVHGSRGLSGELGHVGVRRDGRRCRCGKRGCLETVASLPAVLQTCEERGLALGGVTDLGAAVERADPILEEVLREAGTATGQVLAATVLTLNPTDVVVGGALAQIAPLFVQQISSTITFEVHPIDGARPRVRQSEHGDSGGALGAIVALVHRSSLLADYPGARAETSDPRLPRSPA